MSETTAKRRSARIDTTTTERAEQLRRLYQSSLPSTVPNHVFVVRDQDEIDVRAQTLLATLRGVGITDLTTQGTIELGGTVEVAAGITSGAPRTPVAHDGTLVGIGAAGQVRPTVLRHRTLTSADPGGSPRTRLAAEPSVVINVDEAIMVFETMALEDDTVILLDPVVRHLTILAMQLTVGRNCSIEWQPATRTKPAARGRGADGQSYLPAEQTSASALHSPDGGNGADGPTGHTGDRGEAAPTVEIWALEANRMPDFHLRGGAGGPGGNGGAGGNGGNGAMGLEADANFLRCVREAGWGGDGGDAGNGGDGGTGGAGGDGGNVALYLPDAVHEAVLERGFRIDNGGGRGGEAGTPGIFGLFGLGGAPGQPKNPACGARPERAGSPGRAGVPGDPGAEGNEGDPGTLTALVITEAEFVDKWTDPQLRRVVPEAAHVGETVQLLGANFVTGMVATIGDRSVSTTFVSDTILTAVVPSLPAGYADVVVASGSDTSNLASLTVLASIASVTPSPARLGQTVVISGSGFSPDSRVLFRDQELVPSASTGTSITVLLPAPSGMFEDPGGVARIAVRGSDGVPTASLDLPLRHVIDTGFDVGRDGYRFSNNPAGGFAGMSTFRETYGGFEVDQQWVMNPVLTGAWYAFYLDFFNNTRPGLSSGFSTTAAEAYWGGEGPLWPRYATMAQVERELTIAQGHILSEELLGILAEQSAAGVGRARTSADEIAATFRRMISMSEADRRAIAPIMQLMPSGTILTNGYVRKLSRSHGLLPIRIEYPKAGEAWDVRVVVYDNAQPIGPGNETFIDIDGSGAGTTFAISHQNSAGPPVADNRDSSRRWTLSHVSLDRCWLSDVSMPTSFLAMPGPATAVVTDGSGRRFGIAGEKSYGDVPGAIVGVEGLYLLPDDETLTITIRGTGDGVYHLALVNGHAGTSTALWDVPVTAGSVDELEVRPGSLSVRTRGDGKTVSVVHGRSDGTSIHALRIDGLSLGRETVTITTADDLSEISIDAAAAMTVPVELLAQTARGAYGQRFPSVELAAGRSDFAVADWGRLDASSLARRTPEA